MKPKSRWVDANKLLEMDLDAALEVIENSPGVDAVEVVRCRDCEYWDGDRRCNGRKNGLVMEFTDDDDFCSYGERRE